MDIEAILYNEVGADSRDDRTVRDFAGSRTIFVPVAGADAVQEVAAALVGEGVQRIELCGALGPRALAKVVTTVDVPIGVCVFGAESAAGAAAFESKLVQGNEVGVALLYLAPGADPVTDEVATARGLARIRFVPVPEPSAVSATVARLVDEGIDLIELYRGFGPEVTAAVLETAAGRVPVGTVLYGR